MFNKSFSIYIAWNPPALILIFLFCSSLIEAELDSTAYAPGAGLVYDILLVMQLLFYFAGLSGWFFANRNIKVKALYVPYYFLFMNISVLWGFKRFLKGQQSVLWEKAAREKAL